MARRQRLEVGVETFARVGWHPDRQGSNHQAVTIDILPECTTSRADIWLWCTFPEVCRRVPARTTRTASRPGSVRGGGSAPTSSRYAQNAGSPRRRWHSARGSHATFSSMWSADGGDCSTNDSSISLRRWTCQWRHCCRNSAAPADDDAARRARGQSQPVPANGPIAPWRLPCALCPSTWTRWTVKPWIRGWRRSVGSWDARGVISPRLLVCRPRHRGVQTPAWLTRLTETEARPAQRGDRHSRSRLCTR